MGEGPDTRSSGRGAPAAEGQAGHRGPRASTRDSASPGRGPVTPRSGDPVPMLRLRKGGREGRGTWSGRREATFPRHGVPALLCNPALPRGAGKGSARPPLARHPVCTPHAGCPFLLTLPVFRVMDSLKDSGIFRCSSREAWAPPSHPPHRLLAYGGVTLLLAGTWEPRVTVSRQQEYTLCYQLPQHHHHGGRWTLHLKHCSP